MVVEVCAVHEGLQYFKNDTDATHEYGVARVSAVGVDAGVSGGQKFFPQELWSLVSPAYQGAVTARFDEFTPDDLHAHMDASRNYLCKHVDRTPVLQSRPELRGSMQIKGEGSGNSSVGAGGEGGILGTDTQIPSSMSADSGTDSGTATGSQPGGQNQ